MTQWRDRESCYSDTIVEVSLGIEVKGGKRVGDHGCRTTTKLPWWNQSPMPLRVIVRPVSSRGDGFFFFFFLKSVYIPVSTTATGTVEDEPEIH